MANMVQNKGIIFKAVPVGPVVSGRDLGVETREFDLNQEPPTGGITTKNFYASYDPYQLGRMSSPEKKSYVPPFPLGGPISNFTVARVLKSDCAKFQPGELVLGMIPTEEYSAVESAIVEKSTYLHKLENPLGIDETMFIGPLGLAGLTAYSSLYDIGKPVKGETIFVFSASGAVGQIVGQLAKHEGLTVIGSVGSAEKLDFITKDLKFDSGFNYKTEDPYEALKRLAPKGIDIYYDNVAGQQLDAALENLTNFGRVVACGMISGRAGSTGEGYGIKGFSNVVRKRLTVRGFIVSDPNMGPVYAEEHVKKVSQWIKDGTFKVKMSPTVGIDNGVDGFLGMLEGKNFGKAYLEIADLKTASDAPSS